MLHPLSRLVGSLLITACACGHTGASDEPTPVPVVSPAPARAEPAAATPEPPPARDEPLCLPIVHGCGCAYACATSLRQHDDGSWEVTHDFQDSATATARVERWCADAAGSLHMATEGEAEAEGCLDVFYDQTPCGGECVPTREYLSCHFEAGRCVP